MSIFRHPCFSSSYPWAILSGILIGTSYIPLPPWAIFFCFVPLWNAWLKENSAHKIFWSGWLTQFVLTMIGFNWVSYTVHEFGHLPWWAAIGTLFLYSSFANLYVPLAGLVWFYFCRHFKISGASRLWALPIFMCIGERAFPMIFDWHFGYTWLWASFPAFHLADMIGFIGLSNVGLFFNALFLYAWVASCDGKKWIPYAAAVPVLFVILNLLGMLRAQFLDKPDAKLNFLLVQATIGNEEKLESSKGWKFRDYVIERYRNLSESGLKTVAPGSVDFIVWPETAFPELIQDKMMHGQYASKLRLIVQKFETTLITGGFSMINNMPAGHPLMNNPDPDYDPRQITNSFFIIGPNGNWLDQPYHKTILLAFGEYMPFGNWFPILRRWIPEVGNFGRGPGPSVLNADKARIGAQICYEGLFDWFTRDLANKGAQIIVNLTNDSWYGTWQQPWQHGYMTLARAIEVRRPLVRSTNTGITTAILASGEILPINPIDKEWFQLYEVPYVSNPRSTIFMSWGYWFIPALLLLGLLGILWNARKVSRTSIGPKS